MLSAGSFSYCIPATLEDIHINDPKKAVALYGQKDQCAYLSTE